MSHPIRRMRKRARKLVKKVERRLGAAKGNSKRK
jgi:hypothetical protein